MAETSSDQQPLSEVMLAMDVVDTLRHRQLLVVQELASEERDQRMLERLRQIYAAQGLQVPELVLQEGVRALRENRFVYQPPSGGLSLALARLYVERTKWLRRAGLGLGILALSAAVYFVAVVWPAQRETAALQALVQEAESARARLEQLTEDAALRRGGERLYQRLRAAVDSGESEAAVAANEDLRDFLRLPDMLAAAGEGALAAAAVPEAAILARASHAEGIAALKAGDVVRANGALQRLQNLREQLEEAYLLRIVSRPGERSGVWRVPDSDSGARNYYIIVEAIGADGRPVAVPVTSEEDGTTSTVSQWGLRVDERSFDRIRADKEDDGIIQDDQFGAKQRGHLDIEYRYPTTGGAITHW